MHVTLEGSRAVSPMDLSLPRPRGIVIGFWIATALLCLQISFTAYAQLRLPQVAEAFTHLGFAFTLGSALIAHFSVGDGPEAWSFAAATGLLWGLSYFFWRRAQVMSRIAA